jgi:hypothetical protein
MDMSDDKVPPVNPLSMYDVAVTTDRVLRIKRALEAAGLSCNVVTTISVNMALDIRDEKKKGKRKK